jgi:ParB family transcriptional regulator, chromosome partitioning protein
LSKARTATFERILDQAAAMFTTAQLRTFLRLLVHIDPYSFLEEVASHFAGNDENTQQTDEEIVLAALDNTADDKLTSLALRLALTDHVGIPRENEPDPLSEAEAVFAPPQPKSSKPKSVSKSKETPTLVKVSQKKSAAKKQRAA